MTKPQRRIWRTTRPQNDARMDYEMLRDAEAAIVARDYETARRKIYRCCMWVDQPEGVAFWLRIGRALCEAAARADGGGGGSNF